MKIPLRINSFYLLEGYVIGAWPQGDVRSTSRLKLDPGFIGTSSNYEGMIDVPKPMMVTIKIRGKWIREQKFDLMIRAGGVEHQLKIERKEMPLGMIPHEEPWLVDGHTQFIAREPAFYTEAKKKQIENPQICLYGHEHRNVDDRVICERNIGIIEEKERIAKEKEEREKLRIAKENEKEKRRVERMHVHKEVLEKGK